MRISRCDEDSTFTALHTRAPWRMFNNYLASAGEGKDLADIGYQGCAGPAVCGGRA